MARDAAPHSRASIWRITGTFTDFLRFAMLPPYLIRNLYGGTSSVMIDALTS